MLKAGDARFGVTQDDGKKGRDRAKGIGIRIYIEAADNIDDVAARAKAAGITLAKEPHDTEWGARAFEVKEPSGFALTIFFAPDQLSVGGVAGRDGKIVSEGWFFVRTRGMLKLFTLVALTAVSTTSIAAQAPEPATRGAAVEQTGKPTTAEALPGSLKPRRAKGQSSRSRRPR